MFLKKRLQMLHCGMFSKFGKWVRLDSLQGWTHKKSTRLPLPLVDFVVTRLPLYLWLWSQLVCRFLFLFLPRLVCCFLFLFTLWLVCHFLFFFYVVTRLPLPLLIDIVARLPLTLLINVATCLPLPQLVFTARYQTIIVYPTRSDVFNTKKK